MWTNGKVAALVLPLLLGACGTRQEQTTAISDDLKRDLAAASTAGGELATPSQSYRRMRFVSDIEQSKAGVPAKRPKRLHHSTRSMASHQPTSASGTDASLASVGSMAAEAPEPVSTPEAPAAEPAIVIAQHPSPEATSAPTESGSDGTMGDHGHGGASAGSGGGGGGLGGLLGGIIGAVVIRGGHGGVDKCDPRTDGRIRPPITDRPDFAWPLPTGRTTFPGSRR